MTAPVPGPQPLTGCDCGHDGLDAMFHLRPCPVAEVRAAARRLGYDLALIGRDTPHTPDVDYLRGAAEALHQARLQLARLGQPITYTLAFEALARAAEQLGVEENAPETAPASTHSAEPTPAKVPAYTWTGCNQDGHYGCTPLECRWADDHPLQETYPGSGIYE